MNVLIITGPLWPRIGNNANLLSKLLPLLTRDHRVHILSPAFEASGKELPETVFDVPVHWVVDTGFGLRRRLWYPLRSKITADPGYSGELGAQLLASAARKLKKEFPYDAILCTMQPYPGLLAASRLRGVRKTAYLMDPPDFTLEDASAKTGQRQILPALRRMDAILTTPFIFDAMKTLGMDAITEKTSVVSFPHVDAVALRPSPGDVVMDPAKINLLYSGALFPSVRDPGYFLRILQQLDDRFCVTFMGRNCVHFWKEHAVPTRAEVRVLPEQPYQIAVNAMNHADVLLNIGNNMHVHMPSKTLDYINTGRPIVNFCKFPDCPTLYYTGRYPLCVNFIEPELSPEDALERFIRFCEENRKKQVPRDLIEENFADCTPAVIASAVLQAVEADRSESLRPRARQE